jgi:hypothetical protein
VANKSSKNPPQELSVADRLEIAKAREMLKRYGQNEHPESVGPLDDLAYEQRNCRMKALDVAVAAIVTDRVGFGNVVVLAEEIYCYIWEGKVPGGTV